MEKYISHRYVSEKINRIKSILDNIEAENLAECTPGELYSLKISIIAIGKELGLPLEDSMAEN